MIYSADWDSFVQETYGRPYCLQQQDGCMDRQNILLMVPDLFYNDEEMPETVADFITFDEMGVRFKEWLRRDPKERPKDADSDFELALWWDRNFYPNLQAVANDLHKKGLLEAGQYLLVVDW